jgi:hypothetical protein
MFFGYATASGERKFEATCGRGQMNYSSVDGQLPAPWKLNPVDAIR